MNIAPKYIILSMLILLTGLNSYAAAPPEGPPPPSPTIVPPGFPIDGSIIALVIVAIVYGVYSLKKFNLQSK